MLKSTIEARSLQRQLRRLGRTQLPAANSRATNRGATSARKASIQIIRRETNLKATRIRRGIRKTSARRATPRALLRYKGQPERLIHFSARQVRQGVSYRTGGRRIRIRSAFIATMPNGSRGVFLRQRKGGRRVGRLPIRQLFGKSIAFPLRPRRRIRQVFEVYRDRYIDVLRQELRFRSRAA